MSHSNTQSPLRVLIVSIGLAAGPASTSQAQTLQANWWQPSVGQVQAVVPSADGEVLYMGGNFNLFGPAITYSAVLDNGTGQPLLGQAEPDNTVYCTIPDGAGGRYIGGLFDTVGVEPRPYVARINADGTLHPFHVELAGSGVWSLLLDGTTLYLGGSFTSIDGQPRACLAAVNADTGEPLAFTAMLSGGTTMVHAMALVGDNLVIAGAFNTVSGSSRSNLAAVDKITGAPTPWAPNPNNKVFAVALSEDGNTLYAAGNFTSISSTARTRTAAFNTATMALLPWTVTAEDQVLCMSLEGDVVVLGGEFDLLNGQAREHLGAVSATTGEVLPWTADANREVRAAVLHNNVAYVGGNFDEIGGVARDNIAAVDMTTGTVTDWAPEANSYVYALARNGAQWLVGGWFTSIGCKVRHKFVAIDANTGVPTDWDPQARLAYGGGVTDMLLSADGQVLYAAGAFNDTIGGQYRKFLVALDANTAQALPWAPQPDGTVYDIELSPDGSVLYAGGQFTNIAGAPRAKLAALSTDPGQTQLLPWNPNCSNGEVRCMDLTSDGSTLFVSGTFTEAGGTIGGQPRDRLAALSTANNNATAWEAPLTGAPNPNPVVNTLLLDPTDAVLYLGGRFGESTGYTVAGTTRNRLAAVSTATGAAMPWNPGANNEVLGLRWSPPGDLIVCGKFDGAGAIGGADRRGFAYLDATTGEVRPWSVALNYGGYGMNAWEYGDELFLSGYFGEVDGQACNFMAVFSNPGAGLVEFGTSSPIPVYPNPTTGMLHLPSVAEARSLELFDAMGRIVRRASYTTILSMDELREGLYMLVVRDRAGREIGRNRVMLRR